MLDLAIRRLLRILRNTLIIRQAFSLLFRSEARYVVDDVSEKGKYREFYANLAAFGRDIAASLEVTL
jgi:hypothetical protein